MSVALIDKLTADLLRWRRKLREPALGPTDVVGIAAKAINELEVIFREELTDCLRTFQIEHKALEEMTFGQLIKRLEELNERLTPLCRNHNLGAAEMLKDRMLLEETERQHLKIINQVRRSLHRNDMEATLVSKTPEVIARIEEVLKMPLFLLRWTSQPINTAGAGLDNSGHSTGSAEKWGQP